MTKFAAAVAKVRAVISANPLACVIAAFVIGLVL